MSDEFFVGYLATPPRTARRMKRAAASLLLLAAGAAAMLALATGPFDRAVYEYGKAGSWEGTIEAAPVPTLIVAGREDARSPFAAPTRYPLVAEGKHGALQAVAAFDGAAVRLKAARIVREGTTMLELVDGAIERASPALPSDGRPAPASRIEDLGRSTFSGEIVDSKCFLGVMNPGRLEVHRACAARCIAGGIPPMLFSTDARGREAHLLLVDAAGRPVNDRVLDVIARPVTITGRLERRDNLFYLYADGWRIVRKRGVSPVRPGG
jgi:hypothetical protein